MSERTKLIAFSIPDLAPEVRRPIFAELNAHRKYFPHWLAELRVQYITSGDDGSCFAEIILKPEYFRATLRVYASWLDLPPERRRKTIRHEIGHLYHAHGSETSREAIKQLASDDEAKMNLALAMMKRGFEESAEAFALMIERIEGK